MFSNGILLLLLLVVVVVVHAAAAAYQPTQQQPQQARRAFIVETTGSISAATAAVVVLTTIKPTVSNAADASSLEACPKGSQNCIRTTWTAPPGTSRNEIVKTLTAVLESYPQNGQADVDKGGWTFISNDLTGTSGSAVLEYKSGIGNFAKFFNGGKPFIDDLKLQIDIENKVEIRSSSRIGESDFNVNQKRLQYLVNILKSKYDWNVPDPKY